MGDLFNEAKSGPADDRIETFGDAMAGLIRMFPRHASEIEAWAGAYHRVLGALGPADLTRTWQATIDAWSRTVPPKPADFATNRPARAGQDPEAKAQVRQMQIANAAIAERRQLVDRTLQAYAGEIAALAKEMDRYGPEHIGSIVVTPADRVRAAVVHRVTTLAWPLAVETARGGAPYAQIELSAEDWAVIRMHAETMCAIKKGNAGHALQRKPNPFDEQRRAEMRRRAEEWRKRHEMQGEPVTAEERRAGLARALEEEGL